MKKTILVVEDDEALFKAINKRLSDRGYGVIHAKSVQNAIQELKSNTIDFIWLDHYLPGDQTGMDLVIRMKEETSPWRFIPIYVVSNTASHDKVIKYLSLGVGRYYVKSDVKLEDVIAQIEEDLYQ